MVDDTFVQRSAPTSSGAASATSRYADEDTTTSPWFDIVGVVPAFRPNFTPFAAAVAAGTVAAPVPSGRVRRQPAQRDDGDSAQWQSRHRNSARGCGRSPPPSIRGCVWRASRAWCEAWDNGQKLTRLMAIAIIAVMTSVLLLSAAGIYAMMSFTVARRRREIGIRAALGADARRILAGIFRRAAAQLAAGVALGLTIAATLDWLGDGALTGRQHAAARAQRRGGDDHRRPGRGAGAGAPRSCGAANRGVTRRVGRLSSVVGGDRGL